MLKSQVFFKFATKKTKIFWLFCFCGFTLAEIKQKRKNRKAKKANSDWLYQKKKIKKKLVPNGALEAHVLRDAGVLGRDG